jgi:hypothetical protein
MKNYILYRVLVDGTRVEWGASPTVDGLVRWAHNAEKQGIRVDITDADGVLVYPC